MRAHLLDHLDAVLVGHLEVKNHEAEWLHGAVVFSMQDCLFDAGFALVDRYLTVDAVRHIGDTQRSEEFFEHHQVDFLVVGDEDRRQLVRIQSSFLLDFTFLPLITF